MKIKVRARFNSTKGRFEKYGEGLYLAYLPFEQDEDAETILRELLSKKLGVPTEDVHFVMLDKNNDWIFQIT